MKQNYLLLLLLSAASLKGFAQESQSDLLFRFLGTAESQEESTQEARIEETKSLFARVKEIKAEKKSKLFNGLTTGLALGASALASGIQASNNQKAANEAARAEQMAQDEQRMALARAQHSNTTTSFASSTTTSSSYQSQAQAQSIKNRANSMAARDASNSSVGVGNQVQLASMYESLIRQYPNYTDDQIRQLVQSSQSYSQSQSTSAASTGISNGRIIQCVVVSNGTLTAAKLRVSASNVVNGYTFGGTGGVNNDYNWTPVMVNFLPTQTRDTTDGNIAREYSKKINVGNYTFYFN